MHSELRSAHVLIMLNKYCWISTCFTVCIQPHSEQEQRDNKAEEQLWLVVLPCYQMRYLWLNIHGRDVVSEPSGKYQEEQSLAENLWTQQGALSSGQYWEKCPWALQHPKGLEWKGCRMLACPSQELVMAFWKWAGMDQKVSLCEMQSGTFPFFMLAGKSDHVSSQISVRRRGGWGEIKP